MEDPSWEATRCTDVVVVVAGVQSRAGRADLAPHRFDYPDADSGGKKGNKTLQ